MPIEIACPTLAAAGARRSRDGRAAAASASRSDRLADVRGRPCGGSPPRPTGRHRRRPAFFATRRAPGGRCRRARSASSSGARRDRRRAGHASRSSARRGTADERRARHPRRRRHRRRHRDPARRRGRGSWPSPRNSTEIAAARRARRSRRCSPSATARGMPRTAAVVACCIVRDRGRCAAAVAGALPRPAAVYEMAELNAAHAAADLRRATRDRRAHRRPRRSTRASLPRRAVVGRMGHAVRAQPDVARRTRAAGRRSMWWLAPGSTPPDCRRRSALRTARSAAALGTRHGRPRRRGSAAVRRRDRRVWPVAASGSRRRAPAIARRGRRADPLGRQR